MPSYIAKNKSGKQCKYHSINQENNKIFHVSE